MINNRGFSLLEIVIATSISSMLALGTASIFIDSTKMESTQERQFWIAARRIEFQNLIRSQNGWTAILANNPTMACFAAGTSCAGVATAQPLVVPIDAILLDGASASVGMSNRGSFCSNFDSTNGNSACPVGLRLNWQALCDDANCLHAQPKITINFQIKEPGGALQGLRSHDLIAFKDPKLESLNEICNAMGGVLVGITCSIASFASTCDPSNALGAGVSYPLGFDITGAAICGKPNPGTCAASDVATGFDLNGGIQCAPACL